MGKWAARLAEKTTVPPYTGTAKTDKRGLLSVLAVAPEGGADVFLVVPMPSNPPALDPDRWCWPHSEAWNTAEIARFLDRRARLMRWGWAEPEAEKLAERLTVRDRDRTDDRVTCTNCRHYRPGRCGNHKAAGLTTSVIGRDFAAMAQRCPGFQPPTGDMQ